MKEVMRLWLELYVKGGTLQLFFRENNIKNIAIYGGGILGCLLFDDVKKYGINVGLYIDKNKRLNVNGINVIEPSSLNDSDIEGIDLIIICVDYDHMEIKKELSKRVNCNVVILTEIIVACFYKQIIIPYCEKHNIRPYIVSYPPHFELSDLSEYEKVLSCIRLSMSELAANQKYFETLYKFVDEYSDEYIRNVFTQSPVVAKGRTLVHSDIRSTYVNIIQHIRFTHFSPKSFNHTIHLIGHCDLLGVGVDDTRTIASYLQKLLNPLSDEAARYRVLNHGVWGFTGNDLWRAFETLQNISYAPDDIIVIMAERHTIYSSSYDYYKKMFNGSYSLYNNLYKEFNEPREVPLMIDLGHLSYYGMKRVADYLFKTFSDEGLLGNFDPQSTSLHYTPGMNNENRNDERLVCLTQQNRELYEYIDSLSTYKKPMPIIGSIVMNCNPFTKGHRYLIEQAASQVDGLFVFVVEENKSMFSFQDRIRLVEEGIKDLKNVTVLPSGKFILSAATFPEYFMKDSPQEIAIDASIDVEIFAKYIAPSLNICKRFVGQEPFCMITRQYNQSMNDILPKYGIELIELERCSINNKIISASFVRQLIKENRLDELSDFVPETTMNYLKCTGNLEMINADKK